MKKNLVLLLILLGSASWLFAQHDNLTNVSTEYMRMGCRTAALDAADLVVYNPAGLAFLEDGFHINIGNQTFFRKPTHTFTFPLPGSTEKEYQQESPDYYLPNIYLAYKHNKWAAFGGFYISGGGGSLDFPDGSVNTDLIKAQLSPIYDPLFPGGATAYIDASSFYMTPILGFSYAITDNLSAAASVRYVMATGNTKANLTYSDPVISPPPVPQVLDLEYKEKANGIAWGVGLDYRVSDNFNLALRYESKANLDFELDSIMDSFGLLGQPQIHDGELRDRDLPGSLSFGAGVNITEDFSAMLDFSWYFQKAADWDTGTLGTGKEVNWSEVAGDVARFALGLGYDIGDKFTANLWGGYTMYMYDDDAELYAPYDGGKSFYYTKLGVFETIKDNNFSIGAGVKYQISRAFNVNLAFVQTMWPKDVVVTEIFPLPPTYPAYDVTTNNSVSTIAIGVNLLFGGE